MGLSTIKRYLPSPVVKALQYVKHRVEFGNADHRAIFKKIYASNYWASNESRSGPGSEISKTKILREELAQWCAQKNIKTLIDLPCGDFNWMQHVTFPADMNYIGIDIVDDLIADNQKRFLSANRRFLCADIIKDTLPESDAILIKDLFIHFPNASIAECLNRIKEKKIKTKYLLTSYFPETAFNEDIKFGMARAVNVAIAPFNLGAPTEMLKDFDDEVRSRYIGIWKIE